MKDVNILTNNGVDVNKALEVLGDMTMYDETVSDFLAGIGEKLQNLKIYKEASDMTNYAIYAHSIKSDAKYLGFTRLAEIALEHEMKGKENNPTFVLEHYEELVNETNKMITVAKQYMGEAPVAPIQEVSAPAPAPVQKDKAILVVDDSNLIRGFVQKVFNNEYEVVEANDGLEAINIINSNPNKIYGMLLDLNMPNVNGFQVLEYFRQHDLFKKVPVSIITGDDAKNTVERAFEYPIIDVLAKPFNERDVKRVVKKTIQFKEQ